MGLTTRGLAAIKPGEWLTDGGGRGAGRLAAFGMKSGGASLYFRYTLPDGSRDIYPIGHYDEKGRTGLSLPDAREKAGALSRRYLSGDRDLRRIIDAETRETERQRAEVQREAEAETARQTATLGALIAGYVAQLKRHGKVSYREVESATRLHVAEAWPVLWATPAERITPDDLLTVIMRLSDAGKLREAGKMRSYLRAAYSAAISSRRQAGALPALRDLRITTNPARDLEPVTGGSGGTRARALSLTELRAYWKRIAALPGTDGALLRFHLLSGGQRVKQLARLTTADYDADLKAVKLRDGKGKRKEPRIHVVPMIAAAIEAMTGMAPTRLGSFLFTVDAGESGASYFLIQHRLRAVVDAMVEAGDLENGPFTAGDLRRTVETRLAAAGIPMGTRAQLQSHGLSGVQARHYDQHDYLEEKRSALETLYMLAAGDASRVVPIRRKRAAQQSN